MVQSRIISLFIIALLIIMEARNHSKKQGISEKPYCRKNNKLSPNETH